MGSKTDQSGWVGLGLLVGFVALIGIANSRSPQPACAPLARTSVEAPKSSTPIRPLAPTPTSAGPEPFLRVGMTQAEVRARTGKPAYRAVSGSREIWGYARGEVQFASGRVASCPTFTSLEDYRAPSARPAPAAEAASTHPVAENGSYYGQPSTLTGAPRTVFVRGYYRRDGTYVRSHYRSRPSR